MRLAPLTAAATLAGCLFAASAMAETATFSYTGGEQSFTVPAGNSTVTITAVGAPSGTTDGNDGRGAIVSGTVSVSPGQVLYVEVGGIGQANAGGFNGGGDPGLGGAGTQFQRGGGGASDVRMVARANGNSLPSRVIVAAGGGGRGLFAGGDAGAPGGVSTCGGGAGTQTQGGAGGDSTSDGTPGVLGVGGKGANGTPSGAGGGGGGLYGGGGGGFNDGGGVNPPASCGGGGGSSLVPAGGTFALASLTTAPSVSITYTAPPSGDPGGGGPGGGGSGGGDPTPTADIAPPVVTELGLSASAFEPAARGGSIAAAVGTRVFYRLSEAATAKFAVERRMLGRRRGGRCVRSGRGPRCTRYVKLRGGFSHAGLPGLNTFRFTGRIRRRALRPGRYRLVVVATDAAGNRSAPVRRAFRIR